MKNFEKNSVKTFAFMTAVLLSLALISCTKQEEGEGEENEQNITAVKTKNLSSSTLWKFIELNGDIRAEKSLKVYPIMAGKISGSPVHLGSKVKKGEVIAYVDPSTPGTYYRLTEVTSPISGTVISIPLKDGTRVDTDTAVVSIGDLSKLQIITYIPERYVSYLKTGLKADIMLESYQGEVFQAEIKEISPVVDEATRTKEVVLSFNKEDGRINAGMYANIKLYLKEYADVLSVPSSCIVEKNGEKFVYTIDESSAAEGSDSENAARAKIVKVTAHEELDERTIITLADDAEKPAGNANPFRVIVQGYETLQDGSLVNEVKGE